MKKRQHGLIAASLLVSVILGMLLLLSGCDGGVDADADDSGDDNGDDTSQDTSDDSDDQDDTSDDNDDTSDDNDDSGENDSASDDDSSDTQQQSTDDLWANVCPAEERVGTFELRAFEKDGVGTTNCNGAVLDSVTPAGVYEVLLEDGACKLLGHNNAFCDPGCTGGEVCGLDGECHAASQKLNAGEVSVSGLDPELSITPNAITLAYSKRISDPFPAFANGESIELTAAGDAVDGFTLDAVGVEMITSDLSVLEIESGEPAAVTWDASADPGDGDYVHLALNVNTHGALTGWVECSVPDTGSFDIPASMVSEVIALGSSGFPELVLTRQNVDFTTIDEGCVEFAVKAELTLAVEIPGQKSCSVNSDCSDGEVCNDVLLCEK